MYAQEKYVDEPPTVELLRFTLQHYLRVALILTTDHYHAALKQPVPLQNKPYQDQQQTVPPPVPIRSRYPLQLVAYRQQPPIACFNCLDECPLKDRARKPMQQLIHSCRTNPAGEWICPSNPHGVNNDIVLAALPVHGMVTFCINCGRTGHAASEYLVPENVTTEEQVKAAWYAPVKIPATGTHSDDQVN